jgi:hypothetical protein
MNMLNKPHITDSKPKIWTKCPDLDARVLMQEIFCENLFFFFIFFPRITLTTVFFNMLNKLHIKDTDSKIWFNSSEYDARVYKAGYLFCKSLDQGFFDSGHLVQIFDSVSII